jgi:hypothetical protein
MVWVSHMDEVIAEALVFDTPPALPETDLAVSLAPEDAVIPPEPPRIEIVEDITVASEDPR